MEKLQRALLAVLGTSIPSRHSAGKKQVPAQHIATCNAETWEPQTNGKARHNNGTDYQCR